MGQLFVVAMEPKLVVFSKNILLGYVPKPIKVNVGETKKIAFLFTFI